MDFTVFCVFILSSAVNPSYSSPCRSGEIWTECVNPCNTCEYKGFCNAPSECQEGCDCKPQHYRNENGLCVPLDLCKAKTMKCPKNALYVPCAPPTIPSCENPYSEQDYEYDCIPGCICKPGFLKRKDSTCVPASQCYAPEVPPGQENSCQENEDYYECTPTCRNTCQNFNISGTKCGCGPPGCFCKEGLVKRADGKCVHPQQCLQSPSPNDLSAQCPKNAIFIQCGSPCPPTCDDLQPEPCEEKCTTACYCKPGYLKRKDGICVIPEDCHPRSKEKIPQVKCPENAIFIQCGSPCPPTCENRQPEPCEEKCTSACYCKPGYLKSKENKCVKPENCTASVLPPANCRDDEEYYECNPSCKNTCENFNNPGVKCQCGPPGCFCKRGLVKRADGKCILPSQCTVPPPVQCTAYEQYYECTPSCKNTCEHFNNSRIRCPCGPPGCFCKPGLVKKADGKCVHPNQCVVLPPVNCAPYEHFYECTPSCKNTCENFNNPGVNCRCGPPGCFCKKGLVKRMDGMCVLPSQCPVKAICRTNAQFSMCKSPCRPTCKNPSPTPCSESCVAGCFCKDGFLEDEDGSCVLFQNCRKNKVIHCGPDQKYYECTPSCKNTCENFNNPSARCQCGPPGCFCKSGLVKRADGKCVTPKECPVKAVCHANAQFSMCKSPCRPTCKKPSPAPCTEPCVAGCFCKDGYVEDEDGRCVLFQNCKKNCGQDEQFYACTPNCKNTCENFDNPGVRCQCGPPGCFCKEGLVKRADGKCVFPNQCPVKASCRENAQFSMCRSPCRPTCKNPYPNPCNEPCVAGCFCKDGFVEDEDGSCVLFEKCRKMKAICRANAQFSMCRTPCRPTCKNPAPSPCNEPCVAGCFCTDGFVEDQDGRCVHFKNCTRPLPPVYCGQDEEYYQCTPSCKNTCENFNNPGVKCQCGPPGCFCRKGLIKRADGKCVLPDRCPANVACRANAQFSECQPPCQPTCQNPYPAPCNKPCVSGCFCKPGFVEEEDGQCVLFQNCKKNCGQDEEYYECTPSCKNTCENFNNPGVKCQCGPPGCFCKRGLIKRMDGKCVLPSQCPVKAICRANAQFSMCKSPCRPTCKNPSPAPCNERCVSGCFCEDGYVEEEDGRCVLFQNCRKNCGQDEQYYECTPSCKNTCDNFNNPGVRCQCGPPGCFCKEGLVKRADGKCVHPRQCPANVVCRTNAQFSMCQPPCRPTCQNPSPAPCNEPCVSGCFCKPGFVEDEDGTCVPYNNCKKNCGQDMQYYECTPSCKNTCENFKNPAAKCQCGPPGCFCKEGLVKRADGKCVYPNQCPVIAVCRANAQFWMCKSPCRPTCDNPAPAPCNLPCVAGCFCKPGFVEDVDGRCVQFKNCSKMLTPVDCGQDMQYYECTPSCKNTCENFSNPEAKCQCGPPGCFCRKDMVKRADGKCVFASQCPVKAICRANAKFSLCESPCRPTCENPAPAPCNQPCVAGCFCQPGFVEDVDGICVHFRNCSNMLRPASCKPDEQYYECPPTCNNTCEHLNEPRVKCQCGPPGCFCKKGLVKGPDGKCVLPSQCPVKLPVCRENAQFSKCAPPCRPTCQNPYPAPCAEMLCVPGCFCKPGFVEDSDGKCVHLEHCSKNCRHPGEEFQECGKSCPDTCENKGHPLSKSCPYRCNRGCFCKEGLYRTKEGTCVPLKDCPVEVTTVPTPKNPPAVKLPDDCHGCPDRSACDVFCKTMGVYTGLCTGEGHLHCRCT